MSEATARNVGLPDGMDPDDVRVATAPPVMLEPFNLSGICLPADVHAAAMLCELVHDSRPEIMLAAALAIRAPRHGHVCLELSRVAETVTGYDDAPIDPAALDWPAPDQWREMLSATPLVSVRPEGTPTPDPDSDRPLSLVGDRLYLDRYWRYERRVAEVLRRRATRVRDDVDLGALRAALDRLLPPGEERPDRQRLAVATGILRGLTVIAGGPGTGKTHTVARLLAVHHELSADGRWTRIAVAAPTGKAADRLTAALRDAAATLDTRPEVRERLLQLEASTLHRLLGWHPGSHTRFRHDRGNKLPYEVVVVDETSMVSLPLMAKLAVALRPATQLVLVGDPDQLESVEAGAVLGDIVGGGDGALDLTPGFRDVLARATGEPLDQAAVEETAGAGAPEGRSSFADSLIVLGTVRRFGAASGIARLASAVHAGDAEGAITVGRSTADDVHWIEAASDDAALDDVRALIVAAHREVLGAAAQGEAAAALAALGRAQVLCAHRRGPVGVAGWTRRIEAWLDEDLTGFDVGDRWYVGRPVLVTRNDRRLRLFNGDVGVVIRAGEGVQVAFQGAHGIRTFSPSRLEDIATVHAMTIHKSQGSQFGHVVIVLPDQTSAILTRELLYTAITRAQNRVTLIGGEPSLRAGIERRVARASGLRQTLWSQ